MDQDSSNGSVTDKRNWRERLGIGTKDMPKIADEFKAERPAPSLGPAPKPVTKPAPMAPRHAAPKAPGVKAEAARPAPQQSALAEKLRAQREAAEKLAAQRVTAARQRAEQRTGAEPRLSVPPERGTSSAATSRPKFSFADEPAPPPFQAKQGGNGLPPLVPPRPALGGDRAGFPGRTPGYGPASTGYRSEPPPFRPIDPATGFPAPPSRSAPPPFRPYQSPGGRDQPPLPTGRRMPPPPLEDRQYGEEDETRSDPRLTRSMARQRPVSEETDDVFEDSGLPPPPQPARRRASAADYNAAYREAEEGFEEPRRRSGGPWLLLFALLLAAVATGGIVWYYQTKIKPVAATTTGGSTDTVPVVKAPEEPIKTVPETPPEQPLNVQPASKKQIYDRIVGEQEVSGEQIVPTEQTPIQPEGQTNSEAIPQPATGQAGDDSEPLPLPPPPGETGSNTQGSLIDNQAQPEPASGNQSADSIGQLVTETATDTAAAQGNQAAQPVEQPAQDAAANTGTENIGQEPASPAAKQTETTKTAAPAKKASTTKKTTAKAKAQPKQEEATEPVVLVPPSQDAGSVDLGGTSAPSQDAQDVNAGTGEQPAPKKKKTLFDLFKGNNSSNETPEAEPDPVQVASTTKTEEPPPAPKPAEPEAQTAGGAGYVAQLASFRSQGEAQTEYGRLKAKYPGIVGGLEPNISTATVAGSTRYRLGLGPMASRDDASKICGSLLASGERDCIVRKQ